MNYEEKLKKVLFKLKEQRKLTRKKHKTRVNFNDKSFTKVRIGDICKILLQLQDDKGVLKITDVLQPLETVDMEKIGSPVDDYDYENVEEITVELDKKFDGWYEKYLKETFDNYQQTDQVVKTEIKNPVYEIKYSEKAREVLVNNFFLAKPDFLGENELVFTYIYKHPNERISKDRIEKENNIKLTKTLPKILENLGFTGDIRKAFFDVSSKGVLFRNPVTREVLDELKIEYLRLK